MTRIPLRLRLTHSLTMLGMLLMLGITPPALAHSFSTAMLLPADLADDPLQEDLMQAFLLASEERDGHSNETSNGHLGGLDVYISFVTTLTASDLSSADIIALPLAGVRGPDRDDIITIGPPDLTSQAARALLEAPADPALPAFKQRFLSATGHMAGNEAQAVYVTARMIAEAVRKAGGIDDPARLRRLLPP